MWPPVLIGILPNNLSTPSYTKCITGTDYRGKDMSVQQPIASSSLFSNKKLSTLNCLFVKICTVQRKMTIKLRFRNRKTQIYTKIHQAEAGQGVFAEMNDSDKNPILTGNFIGIMRCGVWSYDLFFWF